MDDSEFSTLKNTPNADNQLKEYKKNLKRRKEIAKRYIKFLKDNKGLILPRYSNKDSYFVFQIFYLHNDYYFLK